MLPERKLPQGPWETTRLIGGRCTGAQACQPSRTNRPRGLISPRECARKCGSKNTRHPVSVSDLAGDMRAGATPVPIPNTEVKPGSVDGTADDRLWESRPPPAIPFEARTRTPVRASCFPACRARRPTLSPVESPKLGSLSCCRNTNWPRQSTRDARVAVDSRAVDNFPSTSIVISAKDAC